VISLSDKQLAIVMGAAAMLPVEKRALLLERTAAAFAAVPTDSTIAISKLAVRLSLQGLCVKSSTNDLHAALAAW
jgi:hypothetical protein